MATYSSAILLLCIITSNAKHTYTFSAYTSSNPLWAPATSDTVYFRLCNSANDCGMFTRVNAGWPSQGKWYNYNYVTNQYLGPITKAQVVIEGSDRLCVANMRVDGREYDPGQDFPCIEDQNGGCETLTVDLTSNDWTSRHIKPCQFDGILDDTYKPTTSPTAEPTPAPTSQPTDPTSTPTISPTYITDTPTNDPTMEPTADPTNVPSSSPTPFPTEISDTPTESPTKKPTMTPTGAPFRSADVGDIINGDQDTEDDQSENTDPATSNSALQDTGKINLSGTGMMIGFAFAGLFILTVVIFICYCCYTRKKQKKHLQELKQASELHIGQAIAETNTSPTSAESGNDTNSSQMSELPPIPNSTNIEGEDVLPYETRGGMDDMMDPFDDDEDDDDICFATPQHIGIQMHISECHDDAEEIYGPPKEDNISARDSIMTTNDDTEIGLPAPQIDDEQSSESNNEDMMYGRDQVTQNGKTGITPMVSEIDLGNEDDEDMYGM